MYSGTAAAQNKDIFFPLYWLAGSICLRNLFQEFLHLLGLFDPLCDILYGTLDLQIFKDTYIKYSVTG